jgi:hypothetical protein
MLGHDYRRGTNVAGLWVLSGSVRLDERVNRAELYGVGGCNRKRGNFWLEIAADGTSVKVGRARFALVIGWLGHCGLIILPTECLVRLLDMAYYFRSAERCVCLVK